MPLHRHAIWNPTAEIPSFTKVRPSNNELSKKRSETMKKDACPEQEAARMATLKRLRHKLVTMCAKNQQGNSFNNSKPPTLAMERWLSRESLQRELMMGTTRNDDGDEASIVCNDPILPSIGIADDGLIKDLSRNIDYNTAKTIAETLATDSKSAAERIANVPSTDDGKCQVGERYKGAKAQLKACTNAVKLASKRVQKNLAEAGIDNDDGDSDSGSSNSIQESLTALHKATQQLEDYRQTIQRIQNVSSGKNIVLDNSRRPGICDVMLLQPDGTPKKPYLTISTSHLIKFVQLWQYQHPSNTQAISPKSIAQNPTTAISQMPDSAKFLRHLYCCLARYEMIKGAGYQCAMPPVAFDSACHQLGLGITIECFASPFNCRYRRYCSAFSDLEVEFGSLGSFFDDAAFYPTQGSFEANPPFVPEIMYEMNQKLQRILDHPNAKALSFLVIIPAWGNVGIGYVEELEASSYCVAKSRISASDHSFCDGAQHKSVKQELRPSSWDTAVILLQNQAGSQKWPVSQDQLEKVFCDAWKSSKTKSSLAEWEGRGVAKGGSAKKRPAAPTYGSSSTASTFRGKKTRF